MCGIALSMSRGTGPANLAHLRGMCSALAHRGPDGAGYALLDEARLALGHVRLSIVDPLGGDQPLFNEDQSIALVCNGEIYDYRDHRRTLADRGHLFRTTSDSEVLIHLYEEHGLDFVGQLNGEFAFVLWDARRRLLLAARDHAGIKPLYFCVQPQRLLISSEVKGIYCVPGVPRGLSHDYLTTAGLGVIAGEATALAGVECLRPGHLLVVERDQVQPQRPYSRRSFDSDPAMGFQDACERVRAALSHSVRRRLVADVPVHCYLSGGVDSAIVCGLMAEHGGRFTAYNVGFADAVWDEADEARRIARHYGQQFESVRCTHEMLADNLVATVEHVELPLSNCNSAGRFLLSRLVRDCHAKVCLTGEGADESFGGYAYFKLEALWRRLLQAGDRGQGRDLWRRFRRMERRSFGILWHRTSRWRTEHATYGYPCYAHVRAIDNDVITPYLFQDPPSESLEGRFLSLFPPERFAASLPFNTSRAMAYEMLAGAIIPTLDDRVEMAHGVECRMPFLDRDMVELTGRIPPEHFLELSTLREKRLLHAAFADMLPPSLANTHKHPFMAPAWRAVLATPRGRELRHEYLSPGRLRRVGIYRPRAVAWLQRIWTLAPPRSEIARRLDPLVGMLLTTHLLHERLVERRPAIDERFPMSDRTPQPLPA